MNTDFVIAGTRLPSRLLLGSGRYPSPAVLEECIRASGTAVVTVSLRRESAGNGDGGGRTFWDHVRATGVHILPNTAGCFTVQEAVTTAQMAREIFGTTWIKLEVIGNEQNLQPDPFGTVEAARILCREGFDVFPYTTGDLVVAERLVDAGCRILMPWGSPIGTGRGIQNETELHTLRHRFPDIPLILDAGIGRPSHALQAMEAGFDAVLLNTAVSRAVDPVAMARAFALAVEAGYLAGRAGMMRRQERAVPSTPMMGLAGFGELP